MDVDDLEPVNIFILMEKWDLTTLFVNLLNNAGVSAASTRDSRNNINIQNIYNHREPKVSLLGWHYFQEPDKEDLRTRNTIFTYYLRKKCLPIIIVEKKNKPVILGGQFNKLSRIAIANDYSSSSIESIITTELKDRLYELGVSMKDLPAVPQPAEPEQPKYTINDFSVKYSKETSTLSLKGPIIPDAATKIDSELAKLLSNDEDKRLFVKNNKILSINWGGITYIDDLESKNLYKKLQGRIKEKEIDDIKLYEFEKKKPMFINPDTLTYYKDNFTIIQDIPSSPESSN